MESAQRDGGVQSVRNGRIHQQRDTVYVQGRPEVEVGVVKATPPYLCTHADGNWNWSNNLRSLHEAAAPRKPAVDLRIRSQDRANEAYGRRRLDAGEPSERR